MFRITCLHLLEQIRYIGQKYPVDEIVLVGHACVFRSEIHERKPDLKAALVRSAQTVSDHFRGARVRAFFEETKNGETTFSQVFCSDALSLVAR
jgi:hypothetical protein